jgi:hypothetical protein
MIVLHIARARMTWFVLQVRAATGSTRDRADAARWRHNRSQCRAAEANRRGKQRCVGAPPFCCQQAHLLQIRREHVTLNAEAAGPSLTPPTCETRIAYIHILLARPQRCGAAAPLSATSLISTSKSGGSCRRSSKRPRNWWRQPRRV